MSKLHPSYTNASGETFQYHMGPLSWPGFKTAVRGDVSIAADKQIALDLCTDAGLRGVNAGALQNAIVVEGFTSLLVGINIRNKVKSAGIRITGI